jgi:hypothetical protein
MKKLFFFSTFAFLFSGTTFSMSNKEMDDFFNESKPVLYCSAFNTTLANEMDGIIDIKACDRALNAKGFSPKDQFACSANFFNTFLSKAMGMSFNKNGSVSSVKAASKWQVDYVNYKKSSIESELRRGISDAKSGYANPNTTTAQNNVQHCTKISQILQKNLNNTLK